jgi:FKBP-type peptidyl-prolyl cis-trans isomerase SlyD
MTAQTVQPGKLVSLTYSIRDGDGNTLEHNDLPVSYIHGGAQVLIGGMDAAVAGKQAGDEVEMTISPEQGFGPWDPSLTFTDDLANVPEQFRHVGAEVQMRNEQGDVKTFYVTRIHQSQLTVDGNHPMAGKTLRVHVKILEVRDPTEGDLQQINSPDGSVHH